MIKDNCPVCKHELGENTSGKGENIKPKPGDFSLCLYCQAILKFTPEMKLRAVTKPEIIKLIEENPEMVIRLATAQTIARKAMIHKQKLEN